MMNTNATKRKSPARTSSGSSSSSSLPVASQQKKMRIMNEKKQKMVATTTTTTTCQEYPQDVNNGSAPLRLLISQSSCSLSSSDGVSSSSSSSSSSSRCASPDITTRLLVAVPSFDQSMTITQRKEQPHHPHQSSNLIDLPEVPRLLASKSASSFSKTTNMMSIKDAKSKPASSWSSIWKNASLVIMAFLAVPFCYRIQENLELVSTTTATPGLDSVCVDGGGFSGFWFTLGRLHSISDPLNKQYYCYSAGCLGVVAALSNYTKDEMLHMALDKQNRWKAGTLNRHDIVGAFLDDLIHGTERSDSNQTTSHSQGARVSATATTSGSRSSSSKLLERVQQDPRFLSSLNIITSQRRVEGVVPGMHASIRTPTTVQELREMLLQTTWIPFAVGKSLFYKNHMDGAFTIAQHPACARRVGLALDLDLLMNAVNVNLAGIKAEKFWMAGLEYGL